MTLPLFDSLFIDFQSALAGRYSIDRELGRGGMGVVYLAREVHLDRLVAIKVLPPERAANEALRARFVQEARLAAKLSHPNVIPVHSVHDEGEFVFYVMAYVDGETLAHRVRTRGPLPGSEGARVLREVAWALGHAHAQGLVHRDVKPDNILLETGTGRALVADFGIAAAVGSTDGQIHGTPEFMSPEQALGHDVDARSDLYSLGVTAFWALTGRLPFEGSTPTEVLAKHVTAAAPGVGDMGLPIPRKLAHIVDGCLAKEPAMRPAGADAVAEQLGLALVRRRELPAALRAFVKRNGRIDGAGTIVAGVGVAVAATWSLPYWGAVGWIGTWVGGLVLGPMAYFVHAAMRLSALGFTHQDLAPAFNSELEIIREEQTVEHGRGPSRTETALRWISRCAWVTSGLHLAALLLDVRLPYSVDSVLVASSLVVLPTWSGAWALMQRRRDVDSEIWAKLWTGPIGRLAFSLARRLRPGRALPAAMTHRATELSLGLAAEQLFAGLPTATRQALGDVPSLLGRLQDDAQRLRTHYDRLQDALGARGNQNATDDADLRAERDTAHARLGEAVGALETIRLNLLRLHAGTATVDGLTTQLGMAADVSDHVARLIAAHAEVDRSLEPGDDRAAEARRLRPSLGEAVSS